MIDVRFFDDSLPTPEENLALDEALLIEVTAAAKRGEPLAYLRFWESRQYFVVLGVSCRLHDDVDTEACETAGVPVLRRASGGGTVVQGPGCLNFTLVLPFESFPILRDVQNSYREIVERCGDALASETADIAMRGSCDLARGDRKFSGNAQKRSSHAVLHHGSILYDFDLDRISELLREPKKQPDYRETRRHLDFVMNLPMRPDEIRERLVAAWNATPNPGDVPRPPLDELVDEKYSRRKWTEKF